MCEQLAQGRYLTAERPVVELATSRVASQHLNHYTTRPRLPVYEAVYKSSDFTPKKRFGYNTWALNVNVLLKLSVLFMIPHPAV